MFIPYWMKTYFKSNDRPTQHKSIDNVTLIAQLTLLQKTFNKVKQG